MPQAIQLTGKVAIVTGGTRGIGLAIAAGVAARGADVVICGRSKSGVQKGTELLGSRLGDPARAAQAPTGRVVWVIADIRDPEGAGRLVDTAVSEFGGVDILVNNAGVGGFTPVAEQSTEEWRAIIETNLNGAFYCSRAAVPVMRRRGGGWIINISSLAGTHPFAGGAGYCASKAGLNAFSEALMQEVRYDAIRVAVVAPGSVDTTFERNPGSGADWKLSADDVAEAVIGLLGHDPRSLPSLVEIRPSMPRR